MNSVDKPLAPPTADGQVKSIVRHTPFVLFWFGRVMSTLAFQMLAVAVGWQVYEMTGRALDLGLVGLAQFIPMLCLTLVAGHAADRFDRRLIACCCMFAEAAATALLALGTYEGWLTRDIVLALVALVGAARAFEQPTMAALLQGVAPRQQMQQAVALSSSANQTAQIVGPALGGLLFGLGALTTSVVAAALFCVGGVLIAVIRSTQPTPKRETATLKSVLSGLSFIWRQKVILGTLSLDLFAVLLGGTTALLPIYASDILHAGPLGLGLLRTGPGLGALATALVLARYPIRGNVGPMLFASLFVFSAATIVFGISSSVVLSVAALLVLGAADTISVVIRSTLVQLQTPDEMLGRVSAANFLFIGTSNQLGEFRAGVSASIFGAVPAVLIGGVGTVVVSLLWMAMFPQLRRLKTLEG